MTKSLRPVAADERVKEPLSLLDAVETGDVLAMLVAQRRLMADALMTAAENTRPQFNNELNKLHVLIANEQDRLSAATAEQEAASVSLTDDAFDASAV